jgi:hypothetical protein
MVTTIYLTYRLLSPSDSLKIYKIYSYTRPIYLSRTERGRVPEYRGREDYKTKTGGLYAIAIVESVDRRLVARAKLFEMARRQAQIAQR